MKKRSIGKDWFAIFILSFLFSVSIAVDHNKMNTTQTGNKAMQKVKFSTNMGDIIVELDKEKAPKTVDNFISYVKEGFYDNTIFHRVINNFMIQGGGFEKSMKEKTSKANIENEAANGLQNTQYTIAMARTPDPHSASSQFFINVANNDFLNYKNASSQGFGYCVFGKVIEGTDVVDQIKKVKTTNNGFHQDVPETDVIIQSATLL